MRAKFVGAEYATPVEVHEPLSDSPRVTGPA